LVAVLGVMGVLDERAREYECAARADYYVFLAAMEDSERGVYFRNPNRLEEDTDAMESRLARHEIDCPPASDRLRLPPYEVSLRNWVAARKVIRWLERRREVSGPAEWGAVDDAIEDCRWRETVWGLLADANGSWSNADGRRLLLQRLRAEVGRAAYENGWWPGPLPLWSYSVPGIWE
jgi:hypothetical protein